MAREGGVIATVHIASIPIHKIGGMITGDVIGAAPGTAATTAIVTTVNTDAVRLGTAAIVW